MPWLFFLLFLLPIVLRGEVQLTVEASKKTTKTGETSASARFKKTDLIDQVVLKIGVAGSGPAEVACYFVARDARTHAMKYHGFESYPADLSHTKATIKAESAPTAYSQLKRRDTTADQATGYLPYGWVVIVTQYGQEVAAKASSGDVSAWVKKNPPQRRSYSSP